MEKFYSENDLSKLIMYTSKFSNKYEIEGVVKEVLKIDKTHKLFNSFVEKLCNRFGIEINTTNNAQDCIENIADFLSSLDGIRMHSLYKDSDNIEENINSFAFDLYTTYKKRGFLKLENVKDIALNNDFVIQLKSTAPILNIIKHHG